MNLRKLHDGRRELSQPNCLSTLFANYNITNKSRVQTLIRSVNQKPRDISLPTGAYSVDLFFYFARGLALLSPREMLRRSLRHRRRWMIFYASSSIYFKHKIMALYWRSVNLMENFTDYVDYLDASCLNRPDSR